MNTQIKARLTKDERKQAREGCHFFHNGYCLSDINGKTFCACLKVARDAKKQEKN